MRSIFSFACVFVLLASPSAAQSFDFALCEDTDNHITVSPLEDHFVVHCHLRISDCSNKLAFGRVRSQLPDDGESDGPGYSVVRLVKPRTNNELWGFYFQIPRYWEKELQSRVIYQLEFGIHDPTELDDYPVATAFAWRLIPNRRNRWNMSTDDALIPDRIRTYEIVGGKVVFRYEQSTACKSCEEIPLRFGIGKLDVGEIPADRAARLIE